MLTCLLKRVLPFMLTLLLGVVIGSLFNRQTAPRYGVRTELQSASVADTPTAVFTMRERHSCRHSRSDFGNAPALINYQPRPFYTEEARESHTTGVVKLSLTLGKDGTVSDISVIKGLPDGLTREAKEAASKIEFTPATFDGQPIDSTESVEYIFDGTEQLRNED